MNGSAKDNSKPVKAWMVFKALTQCEYISTSLLMDFFDYQYGDRYIRQITACCISASVSIERYFHRLADALAEVTGREVLADFSPENLWAMGIRCRPLNDAEGWAAEKITQTLRLQQGLAQLPHGTISINGKQYRRIIEGGRHVGWQAGDGHWLTGPVSIELRKVA
ncbi:cellulose synthase operon protein YhjQ/BcsQ [Aeromonas dhakensis]|uniref:cellulose synthase operon protein YhjQ/BcsQ n=2 Tax=Aeromonas dhakensis TaxID=196024 RepID=UPI00398583FD